MERTSRATLVEAVERWRERAVGGGVRREDGSPRLEAVVVEVAARRRRAGQDATRALAVRSEPAKAAPKLEMTASVRGEPIAEACPT